MIQARLPSALSILALVSTLAALSALASGCDFRTGAASQPESKLTGGRLVASEDFSGPTLDKEAWNDTSSGGWTIVDGQLHSKGVKNQALWFQHPLPDKVRVEFDVRSESPEGDIKCEIFGNGSSHESGYILIFGGWKNRINTIARLDEHGKDRKEGAHGRTVTKGQTYRMAIVRTGDELEWYVDGQPFMTYPDASPLRGTSHQHFAFNDWAVPLYFDNLKVYDLSQASE